MKKKIISATMITAWTCIILIIMLFSRHINLEIFFVLWLIGLLFITELIDTRNVKSKYMIYKNRIIAAGIIIFVYLIIQKIMEIIEI